MKPTNQIGRDTTWPVSTEDTMQAIVQNGYDSADVLRLEQVTRPAIADNEVLLRGHAAGLGRGTWHLSPTTSLGADSWRYGVPA